MRNWIVRVVRGYNVYMHADTTVCHILTGDAISQPIRGQILIEAVLYAIILSKIYKVPLLFKGVKEKKIRNRSEEKLLNIPFIMKIFQKKNRNQLKSNKCSFNI